MVTAGNLRAAFTEVSCSVQSWATSVFGDEARESGVIHGHRVGFSKAWEEDGGGEYGL